MTTRTPEARLFEANATDTWRPPTPFKIEFAKFVSNPSKKEKALHIILEKYTHRINPRREFFRATLEEVSALFNLIDGVMWSEHHKEVVKKDDSSKLVSQTDKEQVKENDSSKSVLQPDEVIPKGCRNMSRCFYDGQRISHTIGFNNTWIGTYSGLIEYNEKLYSGISDFVRCHYKSEGLPPPSYEDAWKECTCEVDGVWISTYSLPRLPLTY